MPSDRLGGFGRGSREFSHDVDRWDQGGRWVGHPAALGSVLRAVGPAGPSRLPAHSRRSFDEEDVALSAIPELLRSRRPGPVPAAERPGRPLAATGDDHGAQGDRHDAAPDRQKRGGGGVLGESALLAGEDAGGEGLAEILSREPTPEQAAQFADDYYRFLARLEEPKLQAVALRRLEGQTAREIARAMNVSTKTVERKLQLIRAIGPRTTRAEVPIDAQRAARPRERFHAGRRSLRPVRGRARHG